MSQGSPVPAAGRSLSRRRLLLAGGSALLLAACAQPTPTPAPAKPASPPTAAPPPAVGPTATPAPAKPTAAATAAAKPTAVATAAPAAAKPTVAPAAAKPTASAAKGTLTVYSGRTEKLVGPVIDRFRTATGTEVKVRYGDTAELAAAILEEGKNSPADVYFAQDAGALGAVAREGLLVKLPSATLGKVEERFRSPKEEWVGLSGRARTFVYSTKDVKEADLPGDVHGLTEAKWKGQLGWAPTNASLQAAITAMRLMEGDAATKTWLQAMKANGVKDFKNNTTQVQAAGAGEIQVGLVNHYYLYNVRKEKGDSFPAANYHPRDGGPHAMVNVAGAGILSTSKHRELAEQFIAFMLAPETQGYFAEQTFEYPLISGVKTAPQLRPLSDLKTPKIDLSNLDDLKGTLKLMQEAGVL